MKDCEACKRFELEKKRKKYVYGFYNIPMCKYKNIRIKSLDTAEHCSDFKKIMDYSTKEELDFIDYWLHRYEDETYLKDRAELAYLYDDDYEKVRDFIDKYFSLAMESKKTHKYEKQMRYYKEHNYNEDTLKLKKYIKPFEMGYRY